VEEAREDSFRDLAPLMSDFWSAELGESRFLWFWTTTFVVICCHSLKTLIPTVGGTSKFTEVPQIQALKSNKINTNNLSLRGGEVMFLSYRNSMQRALWI
jgi:hypothetical protein